MKKRKKAPQSSSNQKICMNPHCGKPFIPGHYGQLQKVCSGSYLASCKRCKGRDCRKCGGKGKYKETCRLWYSHFWATTRKRPRSIPDEDFKKLMSAEREAFWKSYLVVARESGLRKGEMLGLTWIDVLDGENVKSSTVIRGQWSDVDGFRPTKTDSGKMGFFLEESRVALKSFMKASKTDGAWRESRIWEVTEASVWSWFTSLQRTLGIANPDTGRPYRVHDLRHTAALRTYKATNDLRQAQVLLGHKNANTTSIYAQERPEEFAAGLELALKKGKK